MKLNRYKLSDLCDIKIGRTPPRKEFSWFNQGPDDFLWVSIKDLGNCNKFIGFSSETISVAGQKQFNIPIVKEGTVLLSFKLTVGRVAIASKDLLTNEAIAQLPIVRKDILDRDFLYYFLKNFNYNVLGNTSSIGNAINSQIIKDMEIDIPDIVEQKKIVKVLSSLDEEINNTQSINAELESLAKELFKHNFIDFDDVDEEEKIDSPLGYKIPKTMKITKIRDLNPVLETGKRPKGGAVEHGEPSVGAENVKTLGYFDYSSIKYIPSDFAKTMKRGIVKGYELLVYKDGGKPGTFIPHFTIFGEGFPFEKFYINEHVFKIDFGDVGFNEFAYFFFNSDYVVNWLSTNGGKAAVPGINQDDIKDIYIFDPSNKEVKDYCILVKPLIKSILVNCCKIKTMEETRDLLMREIINGTIDLPETLN